MALLKADQFDRSMAASSEFESRRAAYEACPHNSNSAPVLAAHGAGEKAHSQLSALKLCCGTTGCKKLRQTLKVVWRFPCQQSMDDLLAKLGIVLTRELGKSSEL